MDFTPTDERRMLADMIDRFVRDDYSIQDRNAAAATETGFSPAKWAELAELGVIAALFPEKHGGFGGEGFDLATVFESLGRGLVVEPLVDNALIPGAILAECGKTDLLADVIAGTSRFALAAYEPSSGYDLGHVETTARPVANGWVLNGQKAVVKFVKGASAVIVSARTEAGVSLFLVPLPHQGAALQSYATVDGGNAAELSLTDVELGADALLGADGAGVDLLENATAPGLIAVCAEALGIMQAIKDMTVEYLRSRKQFGQPIGQFQALQHRMAQILIEIEQARSAVINAAASLNSSRTEREKALSAAKYSIGRIGELVVEECIQIHGGIGVTWEYDLGHYAKRLTMIDHELGDSDFHLARFSQL